MKNKKHGFNKMNLSQNKIIKGTTFVSMFFDLAKHENLPRRNSSKYLKDAEFLLSQDINLVLYLEPDFAIDCMMFREKLGLEKKTLIIVMDVNELPYYPYLPKIKECREKNPMKNGSPIKDTPLYIATVWSKLPLIVETIQLNYFGTTHFAWIDFGISYVAKQDFIYSDLIFNVSEDKIRLLFLRPVFPEDFSPLNKTTKGETRLDFKHYYEVERGIAAAGYMTGSIQAWRLFNTLFDKEVKLLLEENFAPSEQQIFPVLVVKNPNLFSLYRGDYDAILSNYKNFRISLHNIVTNTMIRSRIQGWLSISAKVGWDIYQFILSNYCMEENKSTVLVFLNELFFALVNSKEYSKADSVRKFYKGLRNVYPDIPAGEEFIF